MNPNFKVIKFPAVDPNGDWSAHIVSEDPYTIQLFQWTLSNNENWSGGRWTQHCACVYIGEEEFEILAQYLRDKGRFSCKKCDEHRIPIYD
jgi:hypothetical protein